MHSQRYGRSILAVIYALALLVGTIGQVPRAVAHESSWYSFSPTRATIHGYSTFDSDWGTQVHRIETDIWWQSPPGNRCDPASGLYEFCVGRHQVFESDVWLYNYRDPESAWAIEIWGFSTNYPGTHYLDTRASDPAGELSFSIGTLDPEQFQLDTMYYADFTAKPETSGPNRFKWFFQVGNEDNSGCGIWTTPDWCMLYAHDTAFHIVFNENRRLPGYHEINAIGLRAITTGNGSISVSPSGNPLGPIRQGGYMFRTNTPAVISANPSPGYIFTGWLLRFYDGGCWYESCVERIGWGNPLNWMVTRQYAAERGGPFYGPVWAIPMFGPQMQFPDVPAYQSYSPAVTQLAARGIIRGYQDGYFGPNDPVLRAQAAAFIARGIKSQRWYPWDPFADSSCVAYTWDCEWHNDAPNFTDLGSVDPGLQRDIRTLAYYNVAQGYGDGTFRPTETVNKAQFISFITRAMIAKGYWERIGDNPSIYPNVPGWSGHRSDIVTFVVHAGAIPGTNGNPYGNLPGWDQAASRGWVAETEWQVLNTYFGANRGP